MHGIRFARDFRNRKKIVKFEGCYCGSRDQLLISMKPSIDKAEDARFPKAVPASRGIPREIVENTIVDPFSDLEAIEELTKRQNGEIALVILELIPMNMGFVLPRLDFLKWLRELCY